MLTDVPPMRRVGIVIKTGNKVPGPALDPKLGLLDKTFCLAASL